MSITADSRKQFKEQVKRGKAAAKVWGTVIKKSKKYKKEIESEDETPKENRKTKRDINTSIDSHSKLTSSIEYDIVQEMATLRPYIEISQKSNPYALSSAKAIVKANALSKAKENEW